MFSVAYGDGKYGVIPRTTDLTSKNVDFLLMVVILCCLRVNIFNTEVNQTNTGPIIHYLGCSTNILVVMVMVEAVVVLVLPNYLIKLI